MATTSVRHHHQPLKTLNRGSNFLCANRSAIIAKRKSAVELLQETKALYVKSETVLDRKQELRSSGHFTHSSPCKYASVHSQGPPPPPKSPRLIAPPSNQRKGQNEQLQNTLRKLFNTDSKENLLEIPVIDNENVSPTQTTCHKSLPDLSLQYSNNSVISSPSPTDAQDTASSALSCRSQKIVSNKSLSLSPVKSSLSDGPLHCVDDAHSESTSHADVVMSTASCRNQSQDEIDGCPSPLKSSFSYGSVFSSNDREVYNSRPILRSKSDIGDCSLQGLSDSFNAVSPDLEQFFGQLGLGSSEFQSLVSVRSSTSSPIFFSSTSSLDSNSSDVANEKGAMADSLPGPENAPSIIERNARIIKWLCHCRKVLNSTPTSR